MSFRGIFPHTILRS